MKGFRVFENREQIYDGCKINWVRQIPNILILNLRAELAAELDTP